MEKHKCKICDSKLNQKDKIEETADPCACQTCLNYCVDAQLKEGIKNPSLVIDKIKRKHVINCGNCHH